MCCLSLTLSTRSKRHIDSVKARALETRGGSQGRQPPKAEHEAAWAACGAEAALRSLAILTSLSHQRLYVLYHELCALRLALGLSPKVSSDVQWTLVLGL